MEYVICFGILLIMLCAFYSVGYAINNFFEINFSSLASGYISMVAVFYLVAAGFMYFCGRFSVLFCLFAAIYGIILVMSGYYLCKKSGLSFIISALKSKKDRVLWIAILLIILQGMVAVLMMHSDADDSYYVARTSTIICTDMINSIEPSTGLEQFVFQNQYAMEGYEVWVAWFCRLFNINAATMYHTIFALFLLITHYCVIYGLGKELLQTKASLFLLMAVLFNTFSGYSTYSQGAFAMLRIWQGKAVLVNIVLPGIFLIFVRLIKEKKVSFKYMFILYILLVGGMCVSAVGVYIIPIAYGLLVCVYMLRMIIDRKTLLRHTLYDFVRMCIPIVAVLPFVAITFIKLREGGTIQYVTNGAEELSYMDVINKTNGNRWVIPLVLFVIIYFLMHKDKCKKYILGIFPALCFLTILNPFLCKYIANYITGAPVYWRLFWILQINVLIISFIIDVSEKIYLKYGVVVISAVVIALCGYPVYTDYNFTYAKNVEKISENSKFVADCVLQDGNKKEMVSLFLPEEEGYGIRQYTGLIQLIWPRYSLSYYSSIGIANEISVVYGNVFGNRNISEDDIRMLRTLNTDYIAVYSGTILDDNVCETVKMIGDNGDFCVYRLIDAY